MAAPPAVRGADGGFPARVGGARSEPCVTAAAVRAPGPHPATAPQRGKDLAFLAGGRLAGRGFGPGRSRSLPHGPFHFPLLTEIPVLLAPGHTHARVPGRRGTLATHGTSPG